MRVKALEPITYGSPPVDYKVGDEFDTDEDMHATILGHAKKVMIVENRAMAAENSALEGEMQPDMPSNRQGRYNRRDMRAKR